MNRTHPRNIGLQNLIHVYKLLITFTSRKSPFPDSPCSRIFVVGIHTKCDHNRVPEEFFSMAIEEVLVTTRTYLKIIKMRISSKANLRKQVLKIAPPNQSVLDAHGSFGFAITPNVGSRGKRRLLNKT